MWVCYVSVRYTHCNIYLVFGVVQCRAARFFKVEYLTRNSTSQITEIPGCQKLPQWRQIDQSSDWVSHHVRSSWYVLTFYHQVTEFAKVITRGEILFTVGQYRVIHSFFPSGINSMETVTRACCNCKDTSVSRKVWQVFIEMCRELF